VRRWRHPADPAAQPCYRCLRALAREGHMATIIARRKLLTALAGAAALPIAARAQQARVPVVGFLSGASSWEYASIVAAFRAGLKAAGCVEGQNVAVEYRWAEGHYDRLSTLAAELVNHRVAVIVVNGPAALPARSLTTSIPIIFVTAVD